jgi:ABC-type glycerol-3-phosphate transport system substrate-binding protein
VAAPPQVVEKSVEVTRVVVEEVVKVATPTPAPAAAPAAAPATAGTKRTVLRLQSSFPVDYPNTLVMSGEVFDDFKQTHPDFSVEVAFVDVPDVASSFVKALAVDQAPDFFYAFESQGTLAYGDHLYDLTEFIKGLNLWDDIYQPAKDLWTSTAVPRRFILRDQS